jgi:hypothetical protein
VSSLASVRHSVLATKAGKVAASFSVVASTLQQEGVGASGPLQGELIKSKAPTSSLT